MFDRFQVICDIWTDVSCNKTQLNKCSVGSVPNSFRAAATYSGLETSLLEKPGLCKRHPHGHSGDKEHYEWSENGKVLRTTFGSEESSMYSLGHAKMDFSLLHFVGNTSLPMKSFPISGSPSCSWWIKAVQVVLPIPWWPWQVVFLENPQAGMVFQLQQGSSSSAEPVSGQAFSHHFPRGSQPLWLQLILVGQPRGSLRDVCVFQGLFLIPEDGDRAAFPGFLWQWCCCLRRQLRFVLATGATTTAQGWARRKRSQEGKTGSLFIQMPWQWIGCNYSLKYSLVLIVWVAGNRRNTGETQPR